MEHSVEQVELNLMAGFESNLNFNLRSSILFQPELPESELTDDKLELCQTSENVNSDLNYYGKK